MDGNPGGFDRPKCFGLKLLAPLKLHFTEQTTAMRDDFEEASITVYSSRVNEGAIVAGQLQSVSW